MALPQPETSTRLPGVTLKSAGKANGNEALLFDVSSVGEDEKILRAELHFHLPQAHRHGSRRRAKSVRASVACTHHFCRSAYPLTHIEATRTTAVMDATLPFAQLHAINGTTMAVHMWRKDIKMRGPKDLVRRNPPFLLVFTEADPQLPEPEEAEAVEISEGREKLTAENRILRAKRDTGEYFKYSEPPRVKAKLTRAEDMAEKQKKDPWYGFGDTSDEDEDDEEDDDDDERIVLLDKGVNDQCRLVRRLVSTSSLGLETTILSPSHLDLSQCGGGCEKPGKKSSARARLLWSVGPSMWRGAVCCAPSRLAPLPLMLLDAHGNLVLRLLPDTVAAKCQCL
ncbi:unnamed protein product, partial [Mesorhabditis spiculigera]